MNKDILNEVICSACGGKDWTSEVFSEKQGRIWEGRAICDSCATWFRIQAGVLDLLPSSLRRQDLYSAFEEKHQLPSSQPTGEDAANDQKQGQIEFFSSHTNTYDDQIVQQPLYQSFKRMFLQQWMRDHLKADQWLLDLGCGTGEPHCEPIVPGLRVLGIDISEEMLAYGLEQAMQAGTADHLDFIRRRC